MEEWRIIPGFEEYAASSLGEIKRIVPDRLGRPFGKNLSQSLGNQRYKSVCLSLGGKDRTKLVHRIICMAFHGLPPSPKHQVAHWNGNKTDNRAENLRWATTSENALDRNRHGTMLVGSNHPQAKLDEDKVLLIRADPRGQKTLAKIYGVDKSIIADVKNRRTWRHI